MFVQVLYIKPNIYIVFLTQKLIIGRLVIDLQAGAAAGATAGATACATAGAAAGEAAGATHGATACQLIANRAQRDSCVKNAWIIELIQD